MNIISIGTDYNNDNDYYNENNYYIDNDDTWLIYLRYRIVLELHKRTQLVPA